MQLTSLRFKVRFVFFFTNRVKRAYNKLIFRTSNPTIVLRPYHTWCVLILLWLSKALATLIHHFIGFIICSIHNGSCSIETYKPVTSCRFFLLDRLIIVNNYFYASIIHRKTASILITIIFTRDVHFHKLFAGNDI